MIIVKSLKERTFVSINQTEVIIGIVLLAVCAIAVGVFLGSICRKEKLRQVAEADERMKHLKIEREEYLSLAEKERLIQAEERRLREEAKQKDWREKERLPADTQLFNVYNTGLYSTYLPDMTRGEINIVNLILSTFNPHCIFVDSYFKKTDGKTTQIDVIAVGKRGVFVFESKDYNGWIFGSGSSQKWTQVLAYGHEKHSFYNPIKQNQSHINILKQKLGAQNIPFFSIVVLGNNAEIKKMEYVPKGVFVIVEYRLGDLLRDLQEEPELLSVTQVVEIIKTIKQQRILPQDDVRNDHVAGIKDMLGEARVYR